MEPNWLLYVQCALYASVRVPSYRVAAWCGFLWCVGVSQSSATTFPMFFLQQGCFAMLEYGHSEPVLIIPFRKLLGKPCITWMTKLSFWA